MNFTLKVAFIMPNFFSGMSITVPVQTVNPGRVRVHLVHGEVPVLVEVELQPLPVRGLEAGEGEGDDLHEAQGLVVPEQV